MEFLKVLLVLGGTLTIVVGTSTSSGSLDSTTTITSTVTSQSFVVVAPSTSAVTPSAADASGAAVFTNKVILSSGGLTNAAAFSVAHTEAKDTTSSIIDHINNTTSNDVVTSSHAVTGVTVPLPTMTVVAPGTVFSSEVNSSLQISATSVVESKASVNAVHTLSSASSAGHVYNVALSAGSVADGLSALSPSSTPAVSMPTLDVTASFFPVRYPDIGSVASPAITTTSANHITGTVTSTSIYTRTIDVVLSPTHKAVEQNIDTEECDQSTVFVTVTGRVTVNISDPSSSGHVTPLVVTGSSSGIASPVSQASGVATGVANPAVSSSHQSILAETHYATVISTTSGASPVLSSSVRVSPSSNPGKTNNTNSTVAMPSTSPFLTPNHPSLNITVAGAGKGAEVHSGVTLSLILAFIGGMVFFAN